jgi:diacylglycerol kinase (ATP)
MRLFNAFKYSLNGLRLAIRDEPAFRSLIILAVFGIVAAMLMPLSATAKLCIVLAHAFTLVVELLNTAIEAVVDRIGPEHHPLSGKAKDCGSAAQFVMLIILAGVWVAALARLF